jgi:hypothetical protein
MVGVAQLVEHLVVVQEVAGSSPVTHPNVIHPFRNSVVTVQVVFSPSITVNTSSTSVSVDVPKEGSHVTRWRWVPAAVCGR